MNTSINTLTVGNTFYVSDKECLERQGIDPDQQPFTVYNTSSPVNGYVYVKDRNGITYLFGPGHLQVSLSK